MRRVGVADTSDAVLRRRIRRGDRLRFFSKLDPCLVAMEACAAAPHWARELSALARETAKVLMLNFGRT